MVVAAAGYPVATATDCFSARRRVARKEGDGQGQAAAGCWLLWWRCCLATLKNGTQEME